MAGTGKAKFDKEAAFKSIVGADRQPAPEQEAAGQPVAASEKNKNRVQRSYFLDRNIDKALRRRAIEEEKTLTELINEILWDALAQYREK